MNTTPEIRDGVVALVGDTHCDIAWTSRVVKQAAVDGVHHLLQVGDFGYWPRFKSGEYFLDELTRVLDASGSTLWFLRGNHEDQEVLLGLDAEDDGLVLISDRIRFVPDGTVANWNGRRVLFVGGAPSIDADARIPGKDWFPSEVLSRKGLDDSLDAGQVDVVLSHDCPSEVDLGPLLFWGPGDVHRGAMSLIAESARPLVWAHGHYHRRRTEVVSFGRPCRVESLGYNHSHGAVIYLDSASLSSEYPSSPIPPNRPPVNRDKIGLRDSPL